MFTTKVTQKVDLIQTKVIFPLTVAYD